MASTYTRSSETDSYEILSSYSKTNDQTETMIISSLVKGNTDSVSNQWNSSALDGTYVDTSAIANYPAGIVTKNSVISVQHVEPSELQSYSTQVAGETKTLEMLETSAPIYDANVVITLSHDTVFYDTNDTVMATFDSTDAQFNNEISVNSMYNTLPGPYNKLSSVGPLPTGVAQSISHNTNSAYGKHGLVAGGYTSSFVSNVETTDHSQLGQYSFTPMSDAYQPTQNSLKVLPRATENFDTFDENADVGVVRVQVNIDDKVDTMVQLDDNEATIVTTDVLEKMPLMDINATTLSYDTPKGLLNIPGTMDVYDFYSLFNEAVKNTINEGYKFKIDITSSDAGYHVDENNLISQLDNSNLLDNPYYMVNYVSGTHRIELSNSGISISGVYEANSNSVSIDLSMGEQLSSEYAGVNGQFILNTHTSITRTSILGNFEMDGMNTSDISVDYGEYGINDYMKSTPFVAVMYEKVALKSENESEDNIFKSDNNAFLTLYTNAVVNSQVDSNDVQFNFVNSLFGDDNIRLWNLSSTNSIVSGPDSLYGSFNSTTNQVEDPIPGINVDGVMTNLVNGLTTYDSYNSVLTAKTMENIGLDLAVTGVTGWSIAYSDSSDTYLNSSARNAFDNVCTLPKYSQELITNINNGTSLYYKYEYKTNGQATNFGDLQDYVEVTYSVNEDLSDATTFIISQRELKRTYDNDSATNTTPVNPSSYTLSGRYSADKWQLVQVTKTTNFNVSFDAKYGPFTNIKVSITGITQTDSYYALQNITSNQLAPHSALQYVSSSSILNLTTIEETLTMDNSSIDGIFTAADLKAFYGIIQGKKEGQSSWDTISAEPIDFDVYYGLDNIFELTIEDESAENPDVKLVCEYSPFSEMTNNSIQVQLINNHYYIPFEYNTKNTNYTLTSFTTSPSDIPDTTNLTNYAPEYFFQLAENPKFFTVTDNYACTKSSSWVSTDYTLSVDTDNSDTTTFTVKDTNGNTVFTISKPSTQIYLGNSVVTYIRNDVWRSAITGCINPGYRDPSTSNERTYNEIFESTLYNDSVMSFTNVPGVEVANENLPSYAAGCYMQFRLLGDFLSINLTGTTYGPTNSSYELGMLDGNLGASALTLVFQDNYKHTARFTFDKYRGYAGENMHTYTINRDSTSVYFIVNNEISQTLTSNMYKDQLLTVDNIIDGDGNTVANLGVKFNTYYSIPPTGSTLNYEVSVVGDDVLVTINNPNYTGNTTNIPVPADATPVTNPKIYSHMTDLQTVGRDSMYTFSGNSYINNALVAIRPSRVKLYNTAFPYNFFSYSLDLHPAEIKIYRLNAVAGVQNWLGNPEDLGSNDYAAAPDSAIWTKVASLQTPAQKSRGFDFGVVTVSQDPEKAMKSGVSYLTSTPPKLKFQTMSTIGINSSAVLHTPYNYNDVAPNNLVTVHMPYNSQTTTYNPFAPTNHHDINGNTYSRTQLSGVNNITFELLGTLPSALSLATDSQSAYYGIQVTGIKMKATLSNGLFPSTSNKHVLYDGLIDNIPTNFNVNDTHIVLRNRENSGAVNFSIAQYASDIGYSETDHSYETIYRTTDQSNFYNLNFQIGDPTFYKSDQTLYFNCQANGVRPTLYTVVDLNNPETKLNYRRVYKYVSTTAINLEDLTPLQTLSLTFNNGRSYYDTVVSNPSGFSSLTSNIIWNYADLLQNTNVTGSSIWTTDNDFSDNVYVSWAFGNSNTSVKMTNDLFYVENNEKKWVYLNLEPFQTFSNQFGATVSEVSWDGSVYTPMVSTRSINLQPQLSSPALSGVNYQIEQYSTATLNET